MVGGIAQDDARENRLIDLFNLHQAADRVRHGTDAILKLDNVEYEFELKSATTNKGGISTVRDLGPGHIAKWRGKHWIMAFFEGSKLLYCRYGSPDAMRPWITEKWDYIKADFEMAKYVPAHITLDTMFEIVGKKEVYTKADARKIHKNQMSAAQYETAQDTVEGYSPARMLDIFKDRARYVIERGSTLNNPHIPSKYFESWPEIRTNHAAKLRELVSTWRDAKP
ncbi:hypothetical protein [Sphingobium sp. Z007]|uniref:hypothetical protein n=1 Tax=Sphingobium sp. Z007 TaxID=627495 RepID=UPI001C3D452F|nr:hypothetical protein [Sphingobium sp. Z007]